jgi:hypothetical protein
MDAEPSFTDHQSHRGSTPPPPPVSGGVNLTSSASSTSTRFAKLRSTFKPPTLVGNNPN